MPLNSQKSNESLRKLVTVGSPKVVDIDPQKRVIKTSHFSKDHADDPYSEKRIFRKRNPGDTTSRWQPIALTPGFLRPFLASAGRYSTSGREVTTLLSDMAGDNSQCLGQRSRGKRDTIGVNRKHNSKSGIKGIQHVSRGSRSDQQRNDRNDGEKCHRGNYNFQRRGARQCFLSNFRSSKETNGQKTLHRLQTPQHLS